MKAEKSVIVMDEVDGMGSDRGGIQKLVEFIKKSKQPIICICNDRNHPKVRTLASHCLDLRFEQPNELEIKKLLERVHFTVNVYRKEGVPEFKVPSTEVIRSLAARAKGDIRQILNHVQLWYDKMGDAGLGAITNKDLDNNMNVEDAAKVLLNSRKYMKRSSLENNSYNLGIFRKLTRLTFADYELMPFYIFQNHGTLAGQRSAFWGRGAGSSMNEEEIGYKKIKSDNIQHEVPFIAKLTSNDPFKTLGLRTCLSYDPFSMNKIKVNPKFKNQNQHISMTKKSLDLNLTQLSLNSQLLSDRLNIGIRSVGDYSNLVSRNILGCVYPGVLQSRSVSFAQFPTFLGKFGSENKIRRLMKECRDLFVTSTPENVHRLYNSTDTGANTEDLGHQVRILLGHISDLYAKEDMQGLYELYTHFGIDQNFVKEVLQEMDMLFTGSNSKKTKKSFDMIPAKSKGKYTRFSKAMKKGGKGDVESAKKRKNNDKKLQKVRIYI